DGNRHADWAPHGCYPCLNDDWLSIAVASDAEWRALTKGLGHTGLAADPRFSTFAGRQADRHRLDALLSDITRREDANALGLRLRAEGVAAFKSATSLEVIQNEYLWKREFYRSVTDRQGRQRPILGASWRMSSNPASILRGAPEL